MPEYYGTGDVDGGRSGVQRNPWPTVTHLVCVRGNWRISTEMKFTKHVYAYMLKTSISSLGSITYEECL